jgi:hypothetical protein
MDNDLQNLSEAFLNGKGKKIKISLVARGRRPSKVI